MYWAWWKWQNNKIYKQRTTNCNKNKFLSSRSLPGTRLNKLDLYYQNVRGLRTKLRDFYITSSYCTADVLCISESWLNDTISDGNVVCDMYKIFRKDRDLTTSIKLRGGGVFIAVKNHISADILPVQHEEVEHIFVKLKYNSETIVICCVYLPPLSPWTLYEKHLNDLRTISNWMTVLQ